jgi:hypothetical protein
LPVPLKLTDWGLPAALSLTVSRPVRVPVAVGLNVTDILQVAFGASVAPQLLVWTKSPEIVKPSIASVAVPVFFKFTDFAPLVVPTFCPAKFRLVGERFATGVGVGVAVGVAVRVVVAVGVATAVAVGVAVGVAVLVGVGVRVGVGVSVAVAVAVAVGVGVWVAVAVTVGVLVAVAVGVGVSVAVAVAVAVDVAVVVLVAVGDRVLVAVAVGVGVDEVPAANAATAPCQLELVERVTPVPKLPGLLAIAYK